MSTNWKARSTIGRLTNLNVAKTKHVVQEYALEAQKGMNNCFSKNKGFITLALHNMNVGLTTGIVEKTNGHAFSVFDSFL